MVALLKRRVWWFLLIPLGMFLLLLALPSILGSSWVVQPIVQRLRTGDFELRLASLQLGWFSPIQLQGISIQQSNGPALLTIDRVQSSRGLLGFLLNGRQLGTVRIVKPTIDVELLSDSSNLERLIHALEGKNGPSPSKPKGPLPNIDLDIQIEDFSAKVQRPGDPQPLVIIPPWDAHLQYRSLQGNSRLHVEPTQILQQVEITPELVKLGLGHAIPLLAESAWFEGRISLATGAIDVTLDDPVQSIGEGTLTLHQVKSGPSQPTILQLLDLLAHLRDKPPHHEIVFVDGSQIKIQIHDGIVHHEGLEAGLPKVDERLQIASSGDVGLVDKSLNLTLQCPVPLALLARRQEVRDIGVPMVRIPVGGTLDAPQVRWDTLRQDSGDLLALLSEKVQDNSPGTAAILQSLEKVADGQADEAISVAVDMFKALRDRKKQESNDSNANANKEESKRPVRDALRDLFRGKQP